MDGSINIYLLYTCITEILHLQTAEIDFFLISQKITAITFMISCKRGGRVRGTRELVVSGEESSKK